jgi:uncharacterized Zn-finger protein
MNDQWDEKPGRCPRCGYTYKQTKESYERFQMAETDELDCPHCDHQKHFGVIHAE